MDRNLSIRHLILLSVFMSVSCVAYFYMLDRTIFSSHGFSHMFVMLVTIEDTRASWLMLLACILAAFWVRPEPILKLAEFIGDHSGTVALVSVALLAAGTLIVYHNYPLCMDEYSAVFQSRVFASGHIAAQFAPRLLDWLIESRFNGAFLLASHESGAVIEAYWPGFALVMTPFQYVGAQWLCNPVLAGGSLLLIHRITLEITGQRRAAGMAVLFAVASGAFVANAISFYSMQAHLTANLGFAYLLLAPNRGRAFAAGLVGSLALVLHNPVPHALFALPWILAMALDKTQRRYLLPLIAGYLPIVLGIGLGWFLLRAQIGAGSHTNAILTSVFRFPDLDILNMRAAAIAKMWVWAVPCLFVFAVMGCVEKSDDRRVRLLAWSAVLTFGAYLFVALDQGHGWGYRYFHSAWGVVPILAACAMSGKGESTPRLIAFGGAAAVLSLVLVVPLQLSQMNAIITRQLAQLEPPRRPGNNIYFIDAGAGVYVADMIQIDPSLRDQDLYLSTRGSKLDAELVKRNWPNAIRLGGYAAEQWYLGPADVRQPVVDHPGQKRFVIVPP